MKSIALVAVAGLASAATAQSLSVNLSWNVSQVDFGGTAVATLTASFSTPTAGGYFASISADLMANDNGLATAGAMGGLDWANAALGNPDGGTADGAHLGGIFGSQIALFPPVDTGNPFVIGTFVVTAGNAEGSLTYSAVASDGTPGAFSIADGAPFAAPVFYDGSVFSSDTLRIVPAPSAMALLGLGGLVAGRRRR